VRPQLGADAALKLDCGAGLGAATHITGAFAFAMVAKALELLLKKQPTTPLRRPSSF
jgi:tRNA A37 threonylcarbamoyladenosine dehydratase